jgi:perosamine synthetase
MRIGRTQPPAAAPLTFRDVCHGVAGLFASERSLRALEGEIQQRLGASHVQLVSSGSAALTVALRALKARSAGREVVIPAYTCPSVPAAVIKAGLTPVACDIVPTTFDFDLEALRRTLNSRTLCVVAHHLFGIASDVDRLRLICASRGIPIVEDAAQAMGLAVNGRFLGTLGDVGILSFGRGKYLTCGSGGVIVTNSEEIAEVVGREYAALPAASTWRLLKDLASVLLMTIFIRPRLYWIPASLPFLRLGQTTYPKSIALERLGGLNAALLRDWPGRLARSNRHREQMAAGLSKRLGLALPHGPFHPYLRLPVLVATPELRERLYHTSQRLGLGLSRAYPTAVTDIPEIAPRFAGQRFPVARLVADHILTMPTHDWLTPDDVDAIAGCVWSVAAPAPAITEQRVF